MKQLMRLTERVQHNVTVPLLAVVSLLLVAGVAVANAAQSDAVAEELDRQRDAMQADYEMRRAIVVDETDRRLEALSESTADDSARRSAEQELMASQQQAIGALTAELEENLEILNEARGFAQAEIDGHGELSDSTWAMIAGFADAQKLTMPEGFPVPEVSEDEYEGFPAALLNCTAFEESYLHPWTGRPLTRIVHGVTEERCVVEEEMPGDGLMACRYPLALMPAVADYYANSEKYERMAITSHTEFVDGEPITTNTYLLDGEPYDHPVDTALSDGDCMVSGYE